MSSRDSNKIEEGCLAIVINSLAGNDGISVTVGKYIGVVEGYQFTNHWEVDKYLVSTDGNYNNTVPEHSLLRIDNYKPEKETEEERELTYE